jgi:hypothetical protein
VKHCRFHGSSQNALFGGPLEPAALPKRAARAVPTSYLIDSVIFFINQPTRFAPLVNSVAVSFVLSRNINHVAGFALSALRGRLEGRGIDFSLLKNSFIEYQWLAIFLRNKNVILSPPLKQRLY